MFDINFVYTYVQFSGKSSPFVKMFWQINVKMKKIFKIPGSAPAICVPLCMLRKYEMRNLPGQLVSRIKDILELIINLSN